MLLPGHWLGIYTADFTAGIPHVVHGDTKEAGVGTVGWLGDCSNRLRNGGMSCAVVAHFMLSNPSRSLILIHVKHGGALSHVTALDPKQTLED